MDSKSLALPVKKILNSKNEKRNQDLKTQFFLENYLTVHVSWPVSAKLVHVRPILFCCGENIISYLQWAVFIFAPDKPS